MHTLHWFGADLSTTIGSPVSALVNTYCSSPKQFYVHPWSSNFALSTLNSLIDCDFSDGIFIGLLAFPFSPILIELCLPSVPESLYSFPMVLSATAISAFFGVYSVFFWPLFLLFLMTLVDGSLKLFFMSSMFCCCFESSLRFLAPDDYWEPI